ncbi:hypothetical protein ACX4ZB_04815 [Aerococcus urinae]
MNKKDLNKPEREEVTNSNEFLHSRQNAEIAKNLKQSYYNIEKFIDVMEAGRLYIPALESIQFKEISHNIKKQEKILDNIAQFKSNINKSIGQIQKIENYFFDSVLGPQIKQLQKSVSRMIQAKKMTDELNCLQIVSNSLIKNKWAIPSYYLKTETPFALNFMINYSNKRIDKKLISLYCRNNFKMVNYDFDVLSSCLKDGYEDQIIKMKEIFNNNWKNYTLCIAHLYIIIDRIYRKFSDSHNHLIDGKEENYLKTGKTSNIFKYKEILESNDDYIALVLIIYNNLITLLISFFENVDFKDSESREKFSRHTIIHGVMAVGNFHFIDFIKLLSLTSAFAYMVSNE